jgi:hypothetical protein
LIVNHGAHQIRWEQVGRKLNALEIEVQYLGQRADGECFGQSWNTFKQNMAVCKKSDQKTVNHIFLPYDNLSDF